MAGSPARSRLARHWTLDPQIDFLNHGSFGACPRPVLEAQSRLRARMEAEPVRFFLREYAERLDAARAALARFAGADPDGLVFVPNATTAVNTALRAHPFDRGDEIVLTDHTYPACRAAAERLAAERGLEVVVVEVPFPKTTPDAVAGAIAGAVTPRTRLALIDHVTSPTALVFPIERIVSELAERGVDTLVDGAHGPGMLPLSIEAIGAAYYAGHGHKWLSAPKGAAFLWVREDLRAATRPLVTGHGATAVREGRSRFHEEFDWTGTADPTAWLALPAAIRFFDDVLDGGWDAVRRRNADLAAAGRRLLLDALGVPAPAPEAMLGSMATVPLPPAPESGTLAPVGAIDPLQDRLFREARIEVPVFPWPDRSRRWLRISAQLYNTERQIARLADVLASWIGPA